MKRTRSFVAAGFATAALLLAACGDDDSHGPAAVVNGIEISQQDLVDELEAIDGNEAYVEAVDVAAEQNPSQPAVRGAEEGTFNTAFVATTLRLRILYALAESELEERGVTVEDGCREAAREQVISQYAGVSPEGDGEAVLAEFGDDYAGYLIDREADLLALQAELTGQSCAAEEGEDPVEAYYDENREQFSDERACASHILVETEAEANEIAALLAGGADFAQLAGERSTDTGSASRGGELDCGPAGQFVAPFDDAVFSQPVGVVGAPVQTEFGYHLIVVNERGVPEFEDVRDDVAAALAEEAESAFGAWFEEALATADVTLDPRYGTWDPTTGTIERPESGTDDTSGDGGGDAGAGAASTTETTAGE